MHRIIALAVLIISGLGFAAGQTEPENVTGRFSSSLFILISIFWILVFLTGFTLFFVICRKRGEATVSRPSLNVLQPLPAAARGVDARAVEALPAFVYADVKCLNVGKGALECAICLCEFEDHETLRLLPKCDHVFHTLCIGAWLQNHVTCPVCRSDLTAEPVDEKITGAESRTGDGRHDEPAVRTEPGHVSIMVEPSAHAKLLRWNSTGHLTVKPRETENTDRFTLRLPDEIRKQILGVGEGSSRRGRRLNRRQSMSERWFVFRTSSFRWRNGPTMSPKSDSLDEAISVHIRPDGPVRPPV